MTLREAFKAWAMAPRNMLLAQKSRNAVEKVLMKKYSDVDLEQVTTNLALRIFERCTEPQELKSKAASILVHLLNWGGDHGYCKRPSFDFTIASSNECLPEKPKVEYAKPQHEIAGSTFYDEPIVKVKMEALEKRKAELEKRKTEDMNESRPRGKQPRPCVQIDVKTLKPIKTWPSINEVYKELGIKNIERAIQRKGISGGFYWCNVGEETDFKPNKVSLTQMEAEQKKLYKKAEQKLKEDTERHIDGNPIGMSPNMGIVYMNDITRCSDQELIAEMKRRGWKGNITITINVEL